MKRVYIICMIMVLVISIVLSAACADASLSSGLATAWSESNYKDWNVFDYLEIGNTGEGFISARNGHANRLIHASKNENGEWKIGWSNESALPQHASDTEMPEAEFIKLIDRSNSSYAGLNLKMAFSYRTQKNGCYEYIFQKHSNTWLLEEIVYIDTDGTLLEIYRITDDGVTYKGWLTNDRTTFIAGRVQRDLRYFSCGGFPTDLNALRNTLSNPPKIPTGTLIAEEIKFSGGKKYSVFSGPGEYYLRGGNGKAAVSTNDWIQVFGRENGWIMIQYDITSDHMRIGWIKETALPKNTKVKDIDFNQAVMHTAMQCSMTDDPLFSMNPILGVPADSDVTCLATMGNWAYVEWEGTTMPVRGFVQYNGLTSLTEDQVKSIAINILLSSDQVTVADEEMNTYTIYCNYDTTMQWTVNFSSGENVFNVVVNDRTGTGWISDNG